MGFTIQDMMTECGSRYRMKLVAGHAGWSNSISWAQIVEDTVVLDYFAGKELAITLGVGFQTEDRLLELVHILAAHHSAGLMINIGGHVTEVPESVMAFCEENHLPLITVPWEVYIGDLVHDLSVRILNQEMADEKITQALIEAIGNTGSYRQKLLPFFDVEGEFQIVLLYMEGLEEMDTVVRKKLENRLAIYLENITHNGSFFYYDGRFVLMLNNVSPKDEEMIITGLERRARQRMPDRPLILGIGSAVQDISMLHITYERARAALFMARKGRLTEKRFDDMGIDRLLLSTDDHQLLYEMGEETLRPVLEYDEKHEGCYRETLKIYLESSCSIQAVSEKMYTHRNTIIYRVNHIKTLLGTDLSDMQDRVKYMLAIRIYETGMADRA